MLVPQKVLGQKHGFLFSTRGAVLIGAPCIYYKIGHLLTVNNYCVLYKLCFHRYTGIRFPLNVAIFPFMCLYKYYSQFGLKISTLLIISNELVAAKGVFIRKLSC